MIADGRWPTADLRMVCLCLLLGSASAIAAAPVTASWYGEEHRGRLMANGRPFDPDAFTCASWDYPMGTRLRLWGQHGVGSVVVRVTDRGPARRLYRQGRRLDLSRAAFGKLARWEEGLVRVRVEVLKPVIRSSGSKVIKFQKGQP